MYTLFNYTNNDGIDHECMLRSVGGFGVIVHVDPWLDLFLIGVGFLELIAYFFEESFIDIEEDVIV